MTTPESGAKSRGGALNRFSLWDGLIYLALALAAFLCLVPVLNILAVSFSKAAAAEAGKVSFWPVDFTLASYDNIMKDSSFLQAIGVSVARVLLGTAMSIVVMLLMAYPLSREKADFPMRNVYMWFVVFTMLFSGGLIPTYITITKLKLTNTIWALTVPWTVYAYNVVLIVNFFRSIPKEMNEVAAIDGAGPLTTLIRVYVPVSMPIIATIVLFCALWHWNDYFTGMIYIDDLAQKPLMTYIRSLALTMNFDQLSPDELIKRSEIGSLTYNAAKIVIAMVPVLVIYPFLQQYFVKGIMIGSVKG